MICQFLPLLSYKSSTVHSPGWDYFIGYTENFDGLKIFGINSSQNLGGVLVEKAVSLDVACKDKMITKPLRGTESPRLPVTGQG
jgi:hypothetical protein